MHLDLIKFLKRKFIFLSILTIVSFVFSKNAISVEIFNLNEKNLLSIIQDKTPSIGKIKSSYLSTEINEKTILEQYQLNLGADINYSKTDETPFLSSMTLPSPSSNFSLELSKKFTTGMEFKLYDRVENKDYGSLGDDTRNTLGIEFTMDLLKNFLGSYSKAEIRNAEYETEIAVKQKKISERIFSIRVMKIYWAIIANEEALKISKELLKKAASQASDSEKRYNAGIADSGEVARQKSQVANRKSEIYSLEHKENEYIKQLQELLPELANKKIVIADCDVNKKEIQISKFIKAIESNEQPPLDYTHYDEIMELIKKAYDEKITTTKKHSDPDLEFYSEYKKYGHSGDGVSTAADNSYTDSEDEYIVGLRFKMPLSSEKRNTQDTMEKLDYYNHTAREREVIAKIAAHHSQITKNLKLLKNVLKQQKETSKNLKVSLKSSQRKYKQARIQLRDLINDQEAYLQSSLREVDIKLSILMYVLDYLSVFTEFPFFVSYVEAFA